MLRSSFDVDVLAAVSRLLLREYGASGVYSGRSFNVLLLVRLGRFSFGPAVIGWLW